MSNELTVAIEAAKKGADRALKYFNTGVSVEKKKDNTPVTIADKETEQVIRETIFASFPNAKFVGEEQGGSLEADEFWTVDPIDGTKNYIRGLPFWSVLIAYVKKGELMVGVSYSPGFDELLYAEKGQGAYCNGNRIHVSNVSTIENSFLINGSLKYFEEQIPGFLKLGKIVVSERGYGDFYGYHQVAMGRAEIMMDAHNGPWDIAPLKVIIDEAGGRVTDIHGNDWQFTNETTLATNGLVHDEVVKILNSK